MAIHDFYLRLTSSGEATPLFTALRRLSLLDDIRAALVTAQGEEEEEEESFKGWAVWDQPGQGGTRRFVAARA